MSTERDLTSTNISAEQGEIPQSFNIAVLVSHASSGSNFKAIVSAIEEKILENIHVALVLSDGPDAPSFEFAREHNVFCEGLGKAGRIGSKERDVYSRNLGRILNQNNVKIAVLAGFGKLLTASYLDEFNGVTVNIHPGAIPDEKDKPFVLDGEEIPWNKGMMTEVAVANFLKLKHAVSTVHIVTDEPDFGPVLNRGIEEIRADDTVDSLYGRLKLQEHAALIRALKKPTEIFQKAGKISQKS